MPQKSTFFYPKIASGLVINPIDPKEEVELPRSLDELAAEAAAAASGVTAGDDEQSAALLCRRRTHSKRAVSKQFRRRPAQQ
jgi:hypothetical protein